MADVVPDEYLFDSLHHALKFAYRYSSAHYSQSAMQKMMIRTMPSGKGLGGLDGAAQAGIIRAWLESYLDPHEKNMIIARYTIDEQERIRAMLYFLPVVIAGLPSGVHSRRAADVLIQRWFGQRMKNNEAAAEIGCHRNTVGPMWGDVRRILDSIYQRAEESAYRRMQAACLIP
jgi:hypothetical protein